MKRLVFFFSSGLIIMLLSSGTVLAQGRKLLYYGSTSSSSSAHAYNVGAAKAINLANPDLTVTVIETGATIDNIKRLARNQIDIGMGTTDATYEAYHALGQWKGNPQKDLRLLWVTIPYVQNFVVRADSGVKTLQDLTGKSFSPGFRGSATENLVMQVLDLINIKPKYVRGGLQDAIEGIKDGRLVGYAKSGVGMDMLDSSSLDLATFTPIWLVGFNEKELASVNTSMPFIHILTIRAGIVKGMPEYKTIAFYNDQFGSKNLPMEVGYKVFKAVAEDKTEQEATFPPMKGVNIVENTLKYANTPLHIGVVKYLQEKGHKVPAHLIPPEKK